MLVIPYNQEKVTEQTRDDIGNGRTLQRVLEMFVLFYSQHRLLRKKEKR